MGMEQNAKKILQNMVLELQDKIKDNAISVGENEQSFFNDIRAKVNVLIEMLPDSMDKHELDELVEDVQREAQKSNERTTQHSTISINLDGIEENVENIGQLVDVIRTRFQAELNNMEQSEKSNLREFRLQIFEKIQTCINNYINPLQENGKINFDFLKDEEIIETVKKVMNDINSIMDSYGRDINSKYIETHENIDEICNDDKKSIERQNEEEKELGHSSKALNPKELKTVNLNGVDFYVINEPVMEPGTEKFLQPGVLCSVAAFENVYTRSMGEIGSFHLAQEKTEVYMTIDEARDMGIYGYKKAHSKTKDDHEYEDDPFSAG